MKVLTQWVTVLLLILVCGCSAASPPVPQEAVKADSGLEQAEGTAQELPQSDCVQEISDTAADDRPENYIRWLVQQTVKKIDRAGAQPSERVRGAYEYVIANTSFAKPVGLDIWRIRGTSTELPAYEENRALSPLAFGVGSCEDYACALVLLLEEMGFSARYIPGTTISVQGDFVDHAWVMVELEGQWYHLDPQLEDNIMKKDRLTYRYFLKSDKTMFTDHRWGRNLIQYSKLTPRQRQEVEKNYLFADCPSDWPAPEPKQLPQAAMPNYNVLLAEVEKERKAYEREHGKLTELELHVVPPVFGVEGYGPKDD